jgi:predicted DNA-binding transcriptional regulator AlpA
MDRKQMPDRLWSVQDVSRFLGVPVATLHQWRYLGSGPKAYRVGKHLRYDPADVGAWLATRAA